MPQQFEDSIVEMVLDSEAFMRVIETVKDEILRSASRGQSRGPVDNDRREIMRLEDEVKRLKGRLLDVEDEVRLLRSVRGRR
ncbi:hypothetical protein RBB50_001236 [Rhinocladiella similis]